MQNEHPKTLRMGRFQIGRDLLLHDQDAARSILKDVIVTKAEFSLTCDGIDYVGIHPFFDEVDTSQGYAFDVPIYLGMLYRNEDGTTTFKGWEKLNAK